LAAADIVAGDALGGASVVGGAAAVGAGSKVVGNINVPPPSTYSGRISSLEPGSYAYNEAASTVGSLRAELPSSIKNGGTVAVATIDIPGLPTQLAGHSRISSPQGSFLGSGSGNFSFVNDVLTGGGFTSTGNTHAEYIILDNMADMLRNNPNARGTVNLFVEIPPCGSCQNVFAQFMQKFPNIQLNITYAHRFTANRRGQ
jgi:filamentous hemagglutinin